MYCKKTGFYNPFFPPLNSVLSVNPPAGLIFVHDQQDQRTRNKKHCRASIYLNHFTTTPSGLLNIQRTGAQKAPVDRFIAQWAPFWLSYGAEDDSLTSCCLVHLPPGHLEPGVLGGCRHSLCKIGVGEEGSVGGADAGAPAGDVVFLGG